MQPTSSAHADHALLHRQPVLVSIKYQRETSWEPSRMMCLMSGKLASALTH